MSWNIANMNTGIDHELGSPTNTNRLTSANNVTGEHFKNLRYEPGEVSFRPNWARHGYNVNYKLVPNNDTGTTVPTITTAPTVWSYDAELTVSNPTRPGYSFSGWTIENMDDSEHVIDGQTYTNNSLTSIMATRFKNLRSEPGSVDFTAFWTPNPYEIELNLSGADSPSTLSSVSVKTDDNVYGSDSRAVNVGDRFANFGSGASLTFPEKKGYSFAGFYTLQNMQGEKFIDEQGRRTNSFTTTYFTDENTIDRKGALYAGFSPRVYSIDLYDEKDEMGDTSKTHNTIYLKYDTGIYLDQLCTQLMSTTSNPARIPTKQAYVFAGYYAEIDNTEVQMIDARGNITSALTNNLKAQNMDFYAKWTPIVYTVNYEANKALSGASHESMVLEGKTPSMATVVNLPEPETFAYDDPSHTLSDVVPRSSLGRIFVGWKATPTGTVPASGWSLPLNLTPVNGGQVSVYADWRLSHYKVRFFANSESDPYVLSDEDRSPIFDIDTDYNDKTAPDENYEVSGNQVVGDLNPGYTFTGWNTAPTGQGTSYNVGSKLNFENADGGEVDLVARWRPNNNGSKFVVLRWLAGLDGSYSETGINKTRLLGTAGSPISLRDTTYDIDGQAGREAVVKRDIPGFSPLDSNGIFFASDASMDYSWKPSLDLSQGDLQSAPIAIQGSKQTGVVVLYTRNNYDITYEFNGGEIDGDSDPKIDTVPFESPINPTYVPMREGYTFRGWLDTSTNQVIGYSWRLPARNVTLRAVWDKNKYNVDYDLDIKPEFSDQQSDVHAYVPDAQQSYPTNAFYATRFNVSRPHFDNYTFVGWKVTGMSPDIVHLVANLTVMGGDEAEVFVSGVSETDQFNNLHKGIDSTSPYQTPKVTLKAKWVPKTYKITLPQTDATEEGTKEIFERYESGIFADASTTTPLSSIVCPKRTGFDFGGYYTQPNGAGTQVIDGQGQFRSALTSRYDLFSSDVELYPLWISHTSKITLDSSRAQGTHASDDSLGTPALWHVYQLGLFLDEAHQQRIDGTNLAIVLPAQRGYSFAGYYDEPQVDPTLTSGRLKITSEGRVDMGNFRLDESFADRSWYAKWQANTYGVNLFKKGKDQSAIITNETDATSSLAVIYDYGIFTDKNINISTSGNTIINPLRTGYSYGGYFAEVQNPQTSEIEEVNLISSTGAPEPIFTPSYLARNIDLYARWTPNVATIDYDLNSAGQTGTQTAYWDLDSFHPETISYDVMTTIDHPKRIGYIFKGWEIFGMSTDTTHTLGSPSRTTTSDRAGSGTDADPYVLGTQFKNLTSLNGQRITMVAQWEKEAYTLSFRSGYDVSFVDMPEFAMYDEEFSVPNPYRRGYSFEGWIVQGMDTSTHVIGNTTTTATSLSGDTKTKAERFMNLRSTPGNVEFIATWSLQTYTATLSNQGANTQSAPAQKIYMRYGDGIYLDETLAQKMGAYDNPANLLERTNYRFGGWTASVEGEDRLLIDEDGYITPSFTSTLFAQDTTLDPVWDGKETMLLLDDGTLDIRQEGQDLIYFKYDSGFYLDEDCQEKMTPTENAVIIPKALGYEFGGYKVVVDGQEYTIIDASGHINPNISTTLLNIDQQTDDFILSAIWKPLDYRVIFDANVAAEGTPAGDIVALGKLPFEAQETAILPEPYTLSYDVPQKDQPFAPTVPTARYGRIFDHWEHDVRGNLSALSENDALNLVDWDDQAQDTQRETRVYAHWRMSQYSVNYYANLKGDSDDTEAIYTQSATYGDTLPITSDVTISKGVHVNKKIGEINQGYRFYGWALDREGTRPVSSDATLDFEDMDQSSVSLYAQWVPVDGATPFKVSRWFATKIDPGDVEGDWKKIEGRSDVSLLGTAESAIGLVVQYPRADNSSLTEQPLLTYGGYYSHPEYRYVADATQVGWDASWQAGQTSTIPITVNPTIGLRVNYLLKQGTITYHAGADDAFFGGLSQEVREQSFTTPFGTSPKTAQDLGLQRNGYSFVGWSLRASDSTTVDSSWTMPDDHPSSNAQDLTNPTTRDLYATWTPNDRPVVFAAGFEDEKGQVRILPASAGYRYTTSGQVDGSAGSIFRQANKVVSATGEIRSYIDGALAQALSSDEYRYKQTDPVDVVWATLEGEQLGLLDTVSIGTLDEAHNLTLSDTRFSQTQNEIHAGSSDTTTTVIVVVVARARGTVNFNIDDDLGNPAGDLLPSQSVRVGGVPDVAPLSNAVLGFNINTWYTSLPKTQQHAFNPSSYRYPENTPEVVFYAGLEGKGVEVGATALLELVDSTDTLSGADYIADKKGDYICAAPGEYRTPSFFAPSSTIKINENGQDNTTKAGSALSVPSSAPIDMYLLGGSQTVKLTATDSLNQQSGWSFAGFDYSDSTKPVPAQTAVSANPKSVEDLLGTFRVKGDGSSVLYTYYTRTRQALVYETQSGVSWTNDVKHRTSDGREYDIPNRSLVPTQATLIKPSDPQFRFSAGGYNMSMAFNGWYQKDGNTWAEKWDFENPDTNRMPATDLTLHAQWLARVAFRGSSEVSIGADVVNKDIVYGQAPAQDQGLTLTKLDSQAQTIYWEYEMYVPDGVGGSERRTGSLYGEFGYASLKIEGPTTFTARATDKSNLVFRTVVEGEDGELVDVGTVRWGSDLSLLRQGGGNIVREGTTSIPFASATYYYMMATPPDASYIPNRNSHDVGQSALSIANQLSVSANNAPVAGQITLTNPLLFSFDVDALQPRTTFVNVYTPSSRSEGALISADKMENIESGFMAKDDRELTQQVIAYTEYGLAADVFVTLKYDRTALVTYTKKFYQQNLDDSSAYTEFETEPVQAHEKELLGTQTKKSYPGFVFDHEDIENAASTYYGDGALSETQVKQYYNRHIYNLRFELNGGTIDSSLSQDGSTARYIDARQNQVSYGALIQRPTSDPVRDNYTFVGWRVMNSSVASVDTWVFDGDNPSTVPALPEDGQTLILEAQWEADTIAANSHILTQAQISQDYAQDNNASASAIRLLEAQATVNKHSAPVDVSSASYTWQNDIFVNRTPGMYTLTFGAHHTDQAQGARIDRSIFIVPDTTQKTSYGQGDSRGEVAILGDNILLSSDQASAFAATTPEAKNAALATLSGSNYMNVRVVNGRLQDQRLTLSQTQQNAYWTDQTVSIPDADFANFARGSEGAYDFRWIVDERAPEQIVGTPALPVGTTHIQTLKANVVPSRAALYGSNVAGSAKYALSAQGFAINETQARTFNARTDKLSTLLSAPFANVGVWASTKSGFSVQNSFVSGKLSSEIAQQMLYSNFFGDTQAKLDELKARLGDYHGAVRAWESLVDYAQQKDPTTGKSVADRFAEGEVGEYEFAFLLDFFNYENGSSEVPIYTIKVSIVEDESVLDNAYNLPSRTTLRVWDAVSTYSDMLNRAGADPTLSALEYLRYDWMHCVTATVDGRFLGEPYVIEPYITYTPDIATIDRRYKDGDTFTIAQTFNDTTSPQRNFEDVLLREDTAIGAHYFTYRIGNLSARAGLRILADSWDVDSDGTWALSADKIIRPASVMAKIVEDYMSGQSTIHPLQVLYGSQFNNVQAYEGMTKLEGDALFASVK